MIRYLLAVAFLVAASCSPAWCGEPVMKADPAYGVRYAQERVVELPQDQETPYLTIFGHPNDPQVEVLTKWFHTNETLVGIKNQTKFRVLYTNDPIYAERFAGTMRALPCVRLISASDSTAIEYAGSEIPMTADALARGLNTKASKAECFRRRRNQVQPQPGPDPYVDPAPQPLPPTPNRPRPSRERLPWLLLGILASVGGFFGARRYMTDLYSQTTTRFS